MSPQATNQALPSADNIKFLKSLKELTASIDEGIVITDNEEKILWVNKAFEEICGISLAELSGKKPNSLQGIDTNKNTVKEIGDAVKKEEAFDAEILNYKPDKTPYWIKLNISPLKNEKGVLTNFVAFEHDITEEKQAKKELDETEKQYKDLFEKNPCVMWICDIKDFSFVEVNQAAIDKYGYSREEFLKMSLSDIKPKEDHKMLDNSFLNKSETYRDRGVMKHIKKNGETIFVDVKTNRIQYAGKTSSIALLNDVTDKLIKEEEIEKLNMQLKNRVEFIEHVSDNMPGALFQSVCYPDGTEKLIYATEGFTEFWGVSLTEGLEDSSLRYNAIHPDDKEQVKEAFLASITNLTKLDNKYRYVNNKTGKVIWARITAVPEKMKDGTVTLTGVVMNVDDTEKYYAELEKSNQRYEYVSKAANEMIWDLDLETNIISFGGSYKEMFGYVYEDDKIELSKIMHFIHPDDSERVKKSIADVMSDAEEHFWECKYRVMHKDGRIVYVHDRAYIIQDKHTGKPCRFVGVIQNITQRKKDEDEILEQMKKVNIVIHSITDIFYVIDTNYDLLYTNEAMEKLTGLSKENLTGKNVWKIFEDVDLSFPKLEFEKAFTNKKASEFEMQYHGKTFHVYLHPSELGLAVSGKDVTTLKKREEEIKSNAKFIKEISDSIDGFIFQTEYNPEGISKLNYSSEKTIYSSGLPFDKLEGHHFKILDLVHPDDRENLLKQRKEMVEKVTKLNIKFRYINEATKEIRWAKASAIPTRLSNGNTIVNGIILDITEIENNYKQLDEANTRYEYLSKASHEAIWEVDLELHEVKLGGGYEEIYGHKFPEDKMTYDKWKEAVHPDDLDETIKCMDDALNNPQERYSECSYRIVQPQGDIIDVFERAYIIYDDKTNLPAKIIGSTRDVTTLKKVQSEKDNLIKDLIKRNKALEQFTFMVSHNLRAPLANLMGIHDILEDETTDAETREVMYDLNKKSVYRLNDVIKDMNDILSVKKNLDEDRTEVVFANILNEINDEVLSNIKKTKIVLTSDFTKAASIFSIRSYIHSIFQNLITNSIKYRHDGSSFIKIESDEDAEYIYLTFEDDGMGIDLTKNHNKIFGLYNRFHLGKEGKGMGLFMVKSQIESLDGEISIESKVNVGTKFFIKFKK